MKTKRILETTFSCSLLALIGCADSDSLDPMYSGGMGSVGEGETDAGDGDGDGDADSDGAGSTDTAGGDGDGDGDGDAPPYEFPCDPVVTEVMSAGESVDDVPPLSRDIPAHSHLVSLTPEQVDIGAPGSVILYPHPDDPASQDHAHYFFVGPTFISPDLNDFILDYDQLITDGVATVMTAQSGGGPFHRHQVKVSCGE